MSSSEAHKVSKAVSFIYLQQEDVIACGGLEMQQVIDAVEHAYVLHEQGQCIEPEAPLIQWAGPQGKRILAHPAWVGGDVGMAGIKWIPSNPANPRRLGMPRASAIIILNDDTTGYPLAVMDGTVISAARTGAATAVGARYLARTDSRKASIIGAGPISRTQIMALQVVLPALSEVNIYDIDRRRAEAVAAEMRALYQGIVFIVAPTAEASVRNADIVVTVTSGVSLEHAYLEAGWLKEGVLVSTVAANDARMEVVEQADKLVMTNLEELDNPIWLAGLAVARGVRSREEFVTLGSIITGQNPGRENDRERIFFNPGGMGIEDVAAATRVYRNALERGVGKQLELWHEPIWI
jgi:2,3-diaminopropionate biosynthesis protein SbnB